MQRNIVFDVEKKKEIFVEKYEEPSPTAKPIEWIINNIII